MKKAIIGKKVGMTQIFDESGKVIPVTVVEAGPCVVTQLKTIETDGYEAVQLGFEDIKEAKLHSVVAFFFSGLLLSNDAGTGFNNGNRNDAAALIEDLGHAHFLADDCFLHLVFSPF